MANVPLPLRSRASETPSAPCAGNGAKLAQDDYPVIDELADLVKEHPGVRILVDGIVIVKTNFSVGKGQPIG